MPNQWTGPRPLIDRFAEKVAAVDGSECIEWIGALGGRGGYGKFAVDPSGGQLDYAHRVAYRLFVGPIPDGFEIDHLCRNTMCVNPDHLEAVSPAENKARHSSTVTHCLNGHPFDAENTYRVGVRFRGCKVCRRARSKAWREAHPGYYSKRVAS